jgi:Spy/CpxP family protein refolding chaperone
MSDASRARRSGLLVLLAGWVLGIVTGAALFHVVHGVMRLPFPPWAHHRPPLAHLERRLDLTPEQSERVRAILDRGRVEMRAHAEETRDRIRAVLTPEQRRRFDEMGPPAPPPPPPPPPP